MAKTWQAQVMNFAGIALFEGGGIQWVPTGDYKVVITELDPHSKGTSVFVRAKIADGPQAEKTVVRNNGLTVNEGNARAWKQTFISAGWTEQSMETAFAPTPEATAPLIGRTAYVHVESPPQSEGQRLKMEDIDVSFIREATYKARSIGGTAAPAAPSGMTPSSPPPGLPPAPGAGTVTAAPPPPGGGSALFGAPPNGVSAAPVAHGAPPPPPAQ